MRTGRNMEILTKHIQAVFIKTTTRANKPRTLTEPEIEQALALEESLLLPGVGKNRQNSSRRRAIQHPLTNMNLYSNGDEKRGIRPCPPRLAVIKPRDEYRKNLFTYTPTQRLLRMSPEQFGAFFGRDTRDFIRLLQKEETGFFLKCSRRQEASL